jgi:hypothetical protein
VSDHIRLVGCGFNIMLIAVTVLMVKLDRRKLDSVGIYGGQWKKSCLAGGILALADGFICYACCLEFYLPKNERITGIDFLSLDIQFGGRDYFRLGPTAIRTESKRSLPAQP